MTISASLEEMLEIHKKLTEMRENISKEIKASTDDIMLLGDDVSSVMYIESISLLSVKEYKKYRLWIPYVPETWWLQTPIGKRCIARVLFGGNINDSDTDVNHEYIAVRPALKLRKYANTYKRGDTIEIVGLNWTVLESSGDNLYILCDDIVAKRRFDPENNDWETSELKMWIEEWLKYAVMGLDEIVYEPKE